MAIPNKEKSSQKVPWRMKGKWLKNCSCDSGCPCDFWAAPTHHKCEGMVGMIVDEGNFGNVSLKGSKFVVTVKFPGPLHEGNGIVQPYFDNQMTKEQIASIGQILSGKAGNIWFEVVASLASKVYDPIIAPIHFEHDIKNVTAKVVIPGFFETVTEPIKNLATGDTFHALVQLPTGMEYRIAETGVAKFLKATGDLNYTWKNCHSSLALVEHTQDGLKSSTV